jgi:WD40 repeat protein
LSGHTDKLAAVAFSPDSKSLASAGYDNSAVIWDVETGTQIRQLHPDTMALISLAFSPNGQLLTAGDVTGAIVVWDLTQLGPAAPRASNFPPVPQPAIVRTSDTP